MPPDIGQRHEWATWRFRRLTWSNRQSSTGKPFGWEITVSTAELPASAIRPATCSAYTTNSDEVSPEYSGRRAGRRWV
jgi:hypothetical protein